MTKNNPTSLPCVTLGIPTFNRGNSIEQTLQAVVAQDYPALTIIISDNASSDTTESICKRWQEQHDNITYIRHPVNMGGTENFNFLLAQAKSPYFMWLADDDWIDPNYISECVNALESCPDVILAAGTPKYYYHDTYLYTGQVMNLEQNTPQQRVLNYFATVQHNGIFYGVMRTSVICTNQMKNILGGDLLSLAGMFFLGKARTIETTYLHRRRGGCSLDGKELAKTLERPWLEQQFPRLALARNIIQHIATDKAFTPLTPMQRYWLSFRCVVYAFYKKILTILFKHRFKERAGIPKI
ncbi:glycosyltransferase family 2 protein [Candidatus Venteria ishoeyi]|uniref:GalNAc(5)-diNAcBac-PP-undecaprenol beta-1,3-glucosyltransferase n=1 Tax=Candidatus Venteria ishoeyi TaxID=1899563 RepID=A0A1H6F235_9GAMM|nr:glycosyltransferase family 2 protein [Candidatus Venteria ishoeyi]SEH04190.1 GalNAc(5)-diNAcBac-PP-undecaprenol beta-1%2C3-glucosyltransferase [Candidatus Venteria ishoeyi]